MFSSLGTRGATADQWFGHRSVKLAHALSALKWGDREKVPWCFTHTMEDPLFASIRGGEAVSGCSSAVTFFPPWEQGKNYSSYKAFDTTANDESTPLEVKLCCPRLLLNHSLILPTTQSVTQTHVSSPSPPLGLQDSSAGSGRQRHLLPCTSWCLQRKKGQNVKTVRFCWGFAFGKYAVGFCRA